MSERDYLIAKALRVPRINTAEVTRAVNRGAASRAARVEHAKKGRINYVGPGQKVLAPVVNPAIRGGILASRGWLP